MLPSPNFYFQYGDAKSFHLWRSAFHRWELMCAVLIAILSCPFAYLLKRFCFLPTIIKVCVSLCLEKLFLFPHPLPALSVVYYLGIYKLLLLAKLAFSFRESDCTKFFEMLDCDLALYK